MPNVEVFFSFLNVTLILKTISLTDDSDVGTKDNVLFQGIHTWNMKAVSLTIQKLWPILKFFFNFSQTTFPKQQI